MRLLAWLDRRLLRWWDRRHPIRWADPPHWTRGPLDPEDWQ